MGSTGPSFHKFLGRIATSSDVAPEVILTRWGPWNKGLPLLLTFLARGSGSQRGSAVYSEMGDQPLYRRGLRGALKLVGNLCVYM